MQENISRHIVQSLDSWREATEKMSERAFLAIYGSPVLQAACGIDPANKERSLRKAASSPLHRQFVDARIAQLRSQIDKGGLREAMLRAAIYVGAARQSVDERGFELIRRMRLASTDHQKLTLEQFKTMVRDQFFMLLIDREAALAAIPSMLPAGAEERQAALAAIRDVISASGEPKGEVAERMAQVARLFEGGKPRFATVANS